RLRTISIPESGICVGRRNLVEFVDAALDVGQSPVARRGLLARLPETPQAMHWRWRYQVPRPYQPLQSRRSLLPNYPPPKPTPPRNRPPQKAYAAGKIVTPESQT